MTIADDEFLSKVLIERRKELVGEGQCFFDAMRTNETIVPCPIAVRK